MSPPTSAAATVVLPDYFEASTKTAVYQLTVIGQFVQAIVAKRSVSARHDAYANAHRIPVTEDKPAAGQGTYLHPDVFGRSQGVNSASARTNRHTAPPRCRPHLPGSHSLGQRQGMTLTDILQ